MPSLSLSSSYLIPAILLNPAFVLHIINTFVSHIAPPANIVSYSPFPFFESLGPLPGSTPYFDVHKDDQLCWGYTAIMVFIQVLVFGRVQDNRVQRKTAKAAKIEREKTRKDKLRAMEEERKNLEKIRVLNGKLNGDINGCAYMDGVWEMLEEDSPFVKNDSLDESGKKSPGTESDTSLTETSEEELH